MYIMECIISNVAAVCKLPVHKIRELNLYHDGDKIPTNQVLFGFHLRRCWNELLNKIKYEERTTAVEDFNKLVIVHVLLVMSLMVECIQEQSLEKTRYFSDSYKIWNCLSSTDVSSMYIQSVTHLSVFLCSKNLFLIWLNSVWCKR